MPNLPISQLPLVTSGQPESLMVIVNYDIDPSGVTNSIFFSSLTEHFSGETGSSGTSGISGSSGSSGTSGSSGSSGTSGSSGSSGSSGTSGTSAPTPPYPVVYGLFAQTSNSVPVSGTTNEGSIIGTGVGTLSVPASGFSIGDSFNVTVMGHLSAKNNDELTIRIKADSLILGTVGPITMSQTTDEHFDLQLYFTIRAIGGAGVASIMSGGQFNYLKDASFTFEGADYTNINNITFDTTISNTLDITAQWNSSDIQNSIYSEILILNKIY